jgi:hypothetical protein
VLIAAVGTAAARCRPNAGIAMSNNFAFGGINTSLVLRRWVHSTATAQPEHHRDIDEPESVARR